jgi:hypothetical protein
MHPCGTRSTLPLHRPPMALSMTRARNKTKRSTYGPSFARGYSLVSTFFPIVSSVRFTIKDSGMLRPYDFLLLGFAVSADPTPFILTTYDSKPHKHVQDLLASSATAGELQTCTLSSDPRAAATSGCGYHHVHLHYNHSINYLLREGNGIYA